METFSAGNHNLLLCLKGKVFQSGKWREASKPVNVVLTLPFFKEGSKERLDRRTNIWKLAIQNYDILHS